MEAYASVQDLESRWRPLTPSEQTVASQLLDDASAMLSRMGGTADADILSIVACSMVRRAMSVSGDAFAIDAPVSGPFATDAPVGDMYVTAQERRLMGIQSVRSVLLS